MKRLCVGKVSKVEDCVLKHDSVCRYHFVSFCTSKWRNFIKFTAAANFSLVGNIRLATAVNLFKTEVGGSGVHFPEKIFAINSCHLISLVKRLEFKDFLLRSSW